MYSLDLSHKNAIVTGGASGLCKCTAIYLARAGANVVVADYNLEGAEKTVGEIKELGCKAFAYKIDVGDPKQLEALAAETIKQFGGIDFLINGAGIGGIEPTVEMSSERFSRIIDINLKGEIWGIKAVLPHMIEKQYGRIVNFSSVAARQCGPGGAAYAASKAGVNAMTAVIAREVAEHGININAVMPGVIRTGMWDETLKEWNPKDCAKREEDFNKIVESMIPSKRPQTPEDVAYCSYAAIMQKKSRLKLSQLTAARRTEPRRRKREKIFHG